ETVTASLPSPAAGAGALPSPAARGGAPDPAAPAAAPDPAVPARSSPHLPPHAATRMSAIAIRIALTLHRGPRAHHVLGPDPAIELVAGDEAELDRGLAQRRSGGVRVPGDGRGAVVAEVRRERGHEHQARAQLAIDLGAVRLEAAREVLLERAAGVAEQADRLQRRVRDQRLVDVELEVAARAADRDRDVVAHHLR